MINIKEDKRLNPLNHSCAHVLAQAVLRLYPKAKLWVGPVIPEGFYYDIDMGDVTLTEDDLPKIEKEMKKICKDGKRIVRHELTRDEALEMFKDNPYKVDIINNLPDSEVITAYSQGEFTDLCRGGHVDSVKECKNFKLLKVSGSYYKGDSKNKVLQRIYGVCFETKEDLESHLQELDEAKERDHRKLGRELGIFMLSDLVGKGFPLWLPNGFTLRHILSEYIMNKELENGYEHVLTPSLGSVDLYKTSGHWDHYKDDMFPPMKMDKEEYVLRPMNCPHHMMIYKNSLHSYRDLPIRIAEIAQDFRYEASGALCGLERARCFTQNDAHLFVRPDQIKEEFKKVIDLILDTYKDFGFKEYSFRLSLRDPNNKEKYFGNDELWERSENELREVLKEYGVDFYEAEGEAAFYGPKLDVQVKSAIGHDVTLSTVQLDYQLPEKFDIDYIAEDGSKQRAVVIHRAIFGSLDRFVAFLLEETKGALPLWLSPIQVSVIPVNNEYHLDYAKEVEMALRKNKIRVHLDGRDEKLGYKLRESVTHKIPYALVLGDKEKDSKNVSFRKYGTDEQGTMSIDEFIEMLKRDENLKK